MARIVVFDSGLGSLSIIKSIQKICKSEIVYFADQKNFPYGKKTKRELKKIIIKTIEKLEKKFEPELIVIGSNTPTIILNLKNKKIIGVRPPLKEAVKLSKTNNIGILGTRSLVKSKSFSKYVKDCNLPRKVNLYKINASNLVQLVETGQFINNKNYCKKIIKNSLEEIILKNKIDVITLSSTHLSFLQLMLRKEFPHILFIDPADNVAKKVFKKMKNKQSKRNLLKIYSSDTSNKFKKILFRMGIKNNVEYLSN